MKSDDSCQMVCYALSDIDSPSIAWKILTHDLPIYFICVDVLLMCVFEIRMRDHPSIYGGYYEMMTLL